MYQRILVPLDGSSLAEAAVEHALAIASRFGSEITLLRSSAVPTEMLSPREFGHEYLQEYRQTEERSILEYLEGWRARVEAQGVRCSLRYASEKASVAILSEAEAREVDLIVMSSHGRGGFQRWLQGSVAETVSRKSSCPVLLLRSAQGERGGTGPAEPATPGA